MKFCSVVIGNVPGVVGFSKSERLSKSEISGRGTSCVQAVQTRYSRKKRVHPLALPPLEPLKVTPTEFAKLQSTCPSLSTVLGKVRRRIFF